ncbi:MAG: ATP-binding protein, partial [Myxococcota bacterium]|nr:ATP-binding protein [Myxococcota bacterium]
SKYIGETEKHLSTVFSAAENGEVMLLFDEADSLFSKRTEVKTSVDRYANLEVNYLLQRMERFDGVVVLTTNFEAGIDDAFARRIRFRVAFPEPDVKHRFRLWRMLMPADVPLAEDVDFRTLAEDYELSGGHIKEIVLRAAALAMGDGAAEQVSQELLIRSAEAEYRKLGKLVMTQ